VEPPELDPTLGTVRAAARLARSNLSGFGLGSAALSALLLLTDPVFPIPKGPSDLQRVWHVVVVVASSSALVGILGFVVALFAAPAKQRDVLLKIVASQASDISKTTPADRLIAVAESGDDLAAEHIPMHAWQLKYQAWDKRATEAVVHESPQHLTVLHSWRLGEDQPSIGETASARDALLRFYLKNRVSALKEIAMRLRARLGEDIGPQTTKRMLLKDLLLDAEHERATLYDERAPRSEVVAWEDEFTRLVTSALPAEDAARFLDRTGFDPSPYVLSEFDEESISILVHRNELFRTMQTELDRIDVTDGFDPRDWNGRWKL
jgi:hypothetical protein